MLFAIAFILTAALIMQLLYHEIPCPLCLLQRVAYLGIGFGIILNLRNGYSMRNEGLCLIMIIVLLMISTHQTLLDIYPRPGHQYIGTSILGLHMPVWSIVFSIIFLLSDALRFSLLSYGDYLKQAHLSLHPTLQLMSKSIIWIIISIAAINLILSFLQCGFDGCHTFGYKLLS